MIRGDERRLAVVQKGVCQFEIAVEIDMVEMKDGQNAGKGARFSEMSFRVDALKFRFKEPGRQPARPFVEIARDDAFTGKARVFENVRVEQFMNLPPPLEKRRSEMDVEKLQVFVSAERDLRQQAAARLAFVDTDVEILRMPHRQTREHRVAVEPAFDLPIFAEEIIHFQLVGDKFGLMVTLVRIFMTQNLLQGDDVGVDFLQNLGDALGRKTPVDADAFVNVICCDADSVHSGRWSVVGGRLKSVLT
jgi:hypothetical protein